MRLRLQEVLQAAGITAADLAVQMGTTRQHVAYLLRVRRCNFQTIARLADALDLPEQELVEFDK